MKATIAQNEIEVTHSIRPDVGREFLTVKVPNGWDDCEKIVNKVLIWGDMRFTWCGWNSDRNEAFFFRPLYGEDKKFATIE